MIIQITDDYFINTEQVNYIKGFTDIGDLKKKTYIRFINKDAVCLPITIEEFTEIIIKHNKYQSLGGICR